MSIRLKATGKDLVWSVKGLPAGLVFNSETHTIEGVITEPGLHEISITVTNSSGSFTHVFPLSSIAKIIELPAARYTGLLDPEGGPLLGVWSIARSGVNVTGTYRSALFTRSFSAKFGPPQVIRYPQFGQVRIARTSVRYQGVGIYLSVLWHLESDRLTLAAYTTNLVDNFSTSTIPETGLASHWEKTTRPHPDAARYTALLYPDEGTGPEGMGFFSLDLAADGTANITGETALGQKFTQSLPVSDTGSMPFFYFSGITLAVGELNFTRDLATDVPTPRIAGEFVWAKDADKKASSYRDGFEQQLLVLGAPLPATGKNFPPLTPLANSANQATFALSGGGLSRLSKPITQTLTPTATGLIAPKAGTPANPNRVSVKLDPKTGIVTGSAAILNATGTKVTRTQSFRGIYLKDPLGDGEDGIGGYFLLPDAAKLIQSGRLEITEPESAPTEDDAPVLP